MMHIFVVKVFSGKPIRAKLAIDLQFRTMILQMFLNTEVASDFLPAAEAIDDEAVTFDLDMFLKILKHDCLLHCFS